MSLLRHLKTMSEAPIDTNTKIRFKKRWLLGVIILLILTFFVYAWSQRIPIADNAIRDQLEKNAIQAEYEVVEIGPRFQKLRNIIIGDPKNPDLTAEEVDIDVEVSLAGAVLKTIWVRGARLNGRYENNRLSFGELDKLIESDEESPIELPDLALDIADSNMRLDTDWGRIGVGLEGRGHLQSTFNGMIALKSNDIRYKDCEIEQSVYLASIKISNKQPRLDGTLHNSRSQCKDIGRVENISVDGEINLSQSFDRWRGRVDIGAQAINSSGININNLASSFDFSGNIDRTDIVYDLKRGSLSAESGTIRNIGTRGEGRLSFNGENYSIAVRGDADLRGASLNRNIVDQLQSFKDIRDDNPVAPLLKIFVPAAAKSVSNFSTSTSYDIAYGDTVNERNNIILNNMNLTSKSGAIISVNDDVRLSKDISSSDIAWNLERPISVSVRGGGLPKISTTITQGIGNIWSGTLDMPAYKTSNSLLALDSLRFKQNKNGTWTFEGAALISGPIPSGFVEGLALLIDGQWNPKYGLSLFNGCKSLSYTKLKLADLNLENQKINVCPNGASSIVHSSNNILNISTNINDLTLQGHLGNSSISIGSSAMQYNLSDGVSAHDVKIIIGEDDNSTIFSMDQLFAVLNETNITGQVMNGKASIASVPLEMEEAQLNWIFEDSILAANGNLMVRDAEQVDRFEPLRVPDLLLSMENGEISALAQLQEPVTGRKVADVDIKHILSETQGRALFSVDNLLFNNGLQPENLTNITLGIVANVQGAIDGDGLIKWNGNDVTSSGKFSTNDMSLAAAFGPVEGLSGEIRLTDLINFVSEDRQILNLGSVNSGVEVLDGRISYQLLPGKKIEIHGGSWPFAGGRLILEPTVWDLAENVERKLAFEATGIEAAIFLQQFDFENLTARGTFNGRLPMVFDAGGGKIVGGSLNSVSGGNIAYVGDLSYYDLSIFGNYAFNALKSIDYKELSIDMNGPIEGEIITGVKFNGLQQGEGAQRNFITKQIAKIPIIFNVTIEAQFLELLGGVNAYNDPEAFVRNIRAARGDQSKVDTQNLNEGEQEDNEQVVQPVESKDSP